MIVPKFGVLSLFKNGAQKLTLQTNCKYFDMQIPGKDALKSPSFFTCRLFHYTGKCLRCTKTMGKFTWKTGKIWLGHRSYFGPTCGLPLILEIAGRFSCRAAANRKWELQGKWYVFSGRFPCRLLLVLLVINRYVKNTVHSGFATNLALLAGTSPLAHIASRLCYCSALSSFAFFLQHMKARKDNSTLMWP